MKTTTITLMATASICSAATFIEDFESATVGSTVDSLANWSQVSGAGGATAPNGATVSSSSPSSFSGNSADLNGGGNVKFIAIGGPTVAIGEDFSVTMRVLHFNAANSSGLVLNYVDENNYNLVSLIRTADPESISFTSVASGVSTTTEIGNSGSAGSSYSGDQFILGAFYTAADDRYSVRLSDSAGVPLADYSIVNSASEVGQFGTYFQFNGAAAFDDVDIRTGADALAIPEPSGTILALFGGLILMRRKR